MLVSLGDIHVNKQGCQSVVIKYVRSNEVWVEFQDQFKYVQKCMAYDLIRGKIKNVYHPSVHGIGFLGDGEYDSKDPAYSCWIRMLSRCYSNRPEYITYRDCTVDSEWHNFQSFAKWFHSTENAMSGFELDKDILVKGNRVYGAGRCCFVPRDINILTQCKKSQRGKFLLGVRKENKKWSARLRVNGVDTRIGLYLTELEAFEAFKAAKEAHLLRMANEYKDALAANVYAALTAYTVDISD